MNRSLLFLFAVFFLQLTTFRVAGQDYPMLHFTVEEGLPSNNVYFVYRDSKGFIWIGTDKGVARYNGIKFELFSTASGLPDNEIFFFQEDYYGRLWLGAFNGALCYYKDGVFHSAANTAFLRIPFGETHAKHISLEKDGSVILSYGIRSKFLVISNERAKIFDLKYLNDTSVSNSVIFARKIADDKYKLVCRDRIIYIDTLYHVTGVERAESKFVSNGDIISSQNQDYLFNDKLLFTTDFKEVEKFPENFTSYNFLHQAYANNDGVCYATNNGLFFNDTVRILKDKNISCVTQDDRKNYWMSTLNDGVYVLKKDFRESRLYKDSYTGIARYAAAINGHPFFADLSNCIYRLEDNKVSCILNYKGDKVRFFDKPVDFGFYVDSNYTCYDVYHDDLTILDHLRSPRTIVESGLNGTKEIIASAGYFYLRQPMDIVRLHFGKGGSQRPDQKIFIRTDESRERIFGMARSPDNSIWYSTIHDMYKVENGEICGQVVPQFRNVQLKYFQFLGNYLVGYTQTNRLLAVSQYNDAKIVVDSAVVDSSFPRNCIWDKFYQLDPVTLLASTNNLYRLITIDKERKPGRIVVYPIENPFLPLHAEAVCTDGKACYFLKNGSITVVNYNSLLAQPAPPKIFFTTLKTSRGTYDLNNEIEIPFNESRNMTISFSTLSSSGRNVRYLYSASKNDNDNWRELNGEEINFVNTPFGVYTIKLKARTASSEFSEPVVLIVHVMRPFWATPGFIIVSFFILAAVVWLLVRLRILYVLQRREKQHTMEIKFLKSEYKALNALMNPHFIFNTLNNVQGLVNRNDKLAANEYIRVFSDLIRQNMHNISKDLIPLQKEISLVTNYLRLEKLRFKEHLNYSIDIEDGLDLSEIMTPPLLVQPLVENSIKHGILPLESREGFIHVNIFEKEGTLIIQVKDNGVGFAAAAEKRDLLHESFGLENMRKRIEQLGIIQNKDIRLSIEEIKNNGRAAGTIVQISIPLHH